MDGVQPRTSRMLALETEYKQFPAKAGGLKIHGSREILQLASQHSVGRNPCGEPHGSQCHPNAILASEALEVGLILL